MKEGSPKAKGARRCTIPDCEFGGRWIVGGMRLLKNGKFSCIGKGCHTVRLTRRFISPFWGFRRESQLIFSSHGNR